MDLSQERFYGAKSEPIDAIEVVSRTPAADFEWQLARVFHGGKCDTYQLLYSDHTDRDALATNAGATAYLAHAASFGEVHGDFSGSHAVPMGAEQSNTNLIVDDEWVVKVFRKLEDGLNPDVELLSVIGDCPHVAGVRGYITLEGATLAMMQERIVGGEDGFQLLMDTDSADEAGQLSFELGQAIRVVHDRLAADFPTREIPISEIFTNLHEHADELASKSQELKQRLAAIHAVYDEIQQTYTEVVGSGTATIQRIHGDLHLGQTLHTPDRWYLIDFEGEPARPLPKRVMPDHPVRDVAGMVRSFGYAAAMSGKDAMWERVVVDKLLAGYAPTSAALLAAYTLDKAAYEVVYEENNRPDWVGIPLRAVDKILTD